MNKQNAKLKESFLKQEIMLLAIQASFQRANIYIKEKINDRDKMLLKESIKEKLEKYNQIYKHGKISDNGHIKNIDNFSKEISEKHERILYKKRFRIGIAQKTINIYLKYLWVLNIIKEPPHCPFDFRIISRLKNIPNKCKNWTKIDNIECYKKLVNSAKEESSKNFLSISEWELKIFEDSRLQVSSSKIQDS